MNNKGAKARSPERIRKLCPDAIRCRTASCLCYFVVQLQFSDSKSETLFHLHPIKPERNVGGDEDGRTEASACTKGVGGHSRPLGDRQGNVGRGQDEIGSANEVAIAANDKVAAHDPRVGERPRRGEW